jgi:trimeric autotransporter adhesin
MVRTRLLLFALFVVALPGSLGAQVPCDAPTARLEELLNPDGTLKGELDPRASVDARGWRITSDSTGRPRFVRSDTMSLSSSAGPDDEHWSQFALPGVNGPVEAIATRGGVVYMGGSFTKAGGADAGFMAIWDSRTYTWSNAARGVDGPVYAVAVDGNDLFVGGMFTHAGGLAAANIARYDLAAGTWHPMGDGSSQGVELVGAIGQVRSIVVVGDSVYVGGRFTRAGDRNANSVALWRRSTSTWSTLASGVTGGTAMVYAMVAHGSELYVGGDFSFSGGARARSISIWNRAIGQWTPLDTGVVGIVRAMAPQGDELYVGGEFTRFGNSFVTHIVKLNMVTKRLTRLGNPSQAGQNYGLYNPVYAIAVGARGVYVGGIFDRTGTNVPVRRIALWTGTTWKALGTGVMGPRVNAIALDGETVYAGGEFTGAGDRIVNYIGMFSGGNWQGLANAPDNGVNGSVYAIAGDGSNLYVGGDFTVAGGVRAHRIARWNGLEWSALGAGTTADLDGAVRAIAITGGMLYAGGEFTTAGGSPVGYVARWSFASNSWSPLGSGTNGPVRALAVSGSRVYAGGSFDTAGGARARNIAAWNGTAWERLGDGAFDGANDTVQALVADGDELFAGGYFTRIGGVDAQHVARWSQLTSTWTALGEGVSGRPNYEPAVHALLLDGATLYAGGEFTRAGDSTANYVAKWNRTTGEWGPIDVRSGRGVCNTVHALALDARGLYVGGRFVVAGDIGARRVALFDGTEWSALGIGLNNGTDNDVYALASYGGEIYAGGRMSLAGGMRANQVARWDGSHWSKLSGDPQLGLDGVVRALAINGDDIYVGGAFLAAGDAAASRIARWNRRTGVWTLLGGGIDGTVFALAATATDVYVGGRFTKAGNLAVGSIARWNVATENWFPIGPIGDNGLDGSVFALAVDDDYLYAGGAFDAAGDIEMHNLARWDFAAGVWEPIGDGTNEPVNALAIADAHLYVGGAFTRAGNIDANFIVRYDPAARTWTRLGGGPDKAVNAIAVVDRRVYVGGDFTTAGIARAAHVGYWDLDAQRWYELGTGVSGTTLTSVYAIAANEKSVYIGGSFTIAGGVDVSHVAHWNVREKSWNAMGSGVGNAELPTVFALALDELGLYVGGNFTRAGDKLSLHFSRWNKLLTGLDPASSDDAHTGDRPTVSLSLSPQPVGHSAEIRFAVADGGSADVRIVAADGRTITTLFDGPTRADGHHIRFDASALAAGTYLCVLRSGGRVVTHTFVVLR